MTCDGHVVQTNTIAIKDDGFKTYEEAWHGLFKALTQQVLADRARKGQSCAEFGCTVAGRHCRTVLLLENYYVYIGSSISPYECGGGDIAYQYELPPLTPLTSKCACQRDPLLIVSRGVV
jgi:hypothetical protein